MLFQFLWPHPYAFCHSAQLAFLNLFIYYLFVHSVETAGVLEATRIYLRGLLFVIRNLVLSKSASSSCKKTLTEAMGWPAPWFLPPSSTGLLLPQDATSCHREAQVRAGKAALVLMTSSTFLHCLGVPLGFSFPSPSSWAGSDEMAGLGNAAMNAKGCTSSLPFPSQETFQAHHRTNWHSILTDCLYLCGQPNIQLKEYSNTQLVTFFNW